MKKVFLFAFSVLASVGIVSAQDDCMTLFPTTEGAMLVNQSFDAQNNMVSKTTYRVGDAYQNYFGGTAEIGFTTVDVTGNVIDQGTMEARCDDGNFYLKTINRSMIPDANNIVFESVEINANFLDYPNTFGPYEQFEGPFEMDGGEFTIKSKNDDSKFMRVRVYNRDYEKNEQITTPAGTFDTSKITYGIEVYDRATDTTTDYKGVEWYALGSGIVRTEIYDEAGNLQHYTVLTDKQD